MDTCMGVSRKEVLLRSGDGKPFADEIRNGALQRIALATEKMAESYDSMRRELDDWKTRAEWRAKRMCELRRQVAALRGVVTKLKRRMVEGEA